eukprot:2652565-Amphidinium_carterae.1
MFYEVRISVPTRFLLHSRAFCVLFLLYVFCSQGVTASVQTQMGSAHSLHELAMSSSLSCLGHADATESSKARPFSQDSRQEEVRN